MAIIKIVCDGICINCGAAGVREFSDGDEEEVEEMYCQPSESGDAVEIVSQAS